jgi:hypothetical protein
MPGREPSSKGTDNVPIHAADEPVSQAGHKGEGADAAAPCRTDRLVRFGFHLNDNDREMTNLCRGAL